MLAINGLSSCLSKRHSAWYKILAWQIFCEYLKDVIHCLFASMSIITLLCLSVIFPFFLTAINIFSLSVFFNSLSPMFLGGCVCVYHSLSFLDLWITNFWKFSAVSLHIFSCPLFFWNSVYTFTRQIESYSLNVLFISQLLSFLPFFSSLLFHPPFFLLLPLCCFYLQWELNFRLSKLTKDFIYSLFPHEILEPGIIRYRPYCFNFWKVGALYSLWVPFVPM